jgi:hypothetical protein
MSGALPGWLLLLVGFVAANLPFFNERLLLLGPVQTQKRFAQRLLELALLAAMLVLLGTLIESHQGQRHGQGWEFYAAVACLMLTFAFPGFVWRHLRKPAPERSSDE